MKKNNKTRLMVKMLMANLSIFVPFIILINVLALTIFSVQLRREVVENLRDKSYNSQIYVMRFIKASDEDDKEESLKKMAPYLVANLARSADVRTQIYSKGELLADSEAEGEAVPAGEDVGRGDSMKCYQFLREGGTLYLSFSSPIYSVTGEGTLGVIRYLYNLDGEVAYQFRMGGILGSVSLVGIVGFWLINIWTSGRIVQPVNELRAACSRLQRGNLRQKVVLNSGDEIEELGHAFNMMSERMNEYMTLLDEQQQQLSNLFNSVTHQLKTPLTSIIGYSQMIQLESDKDSVCEDAFIIEEAGENLLHSIESLLEKSKEKVGFGPLHISTYPLRELIEECVRLLLPRLNKWNIELENQCGESIVLRNDRMLAKEAILCILDNAISHSGCSRIRVYAEALEEKTLLHIVDNGCGIRQKEAKLIFTPFYRVEKTIGQGNGLGLSTCATMMKQNQGSVELLESAVRGTISFVEGDDVNFAAGAYIVIDDVIYGDENTKLSVKAHTDRLCRWLFTKENLVELIGSHDRVVLRSEDERINLSMDQKRRLREVLLEGEALKDSGELSDVMRTKGEGVAQIEIYVSDREEKTPVVYVVLFENGLCMVHDERFVGSIMQLRSEVLAVCREFLEE